MMTPQDETALIRMSAVIPVLTGIARAADALGLTGRMILHAGPPLATAADMSAPLRNAIMAAAVFEGWAATAQQAAAQLDAGEIHLAPAQDHGAVTPLAAVISPSMQVQIVQGRTDPAIRCCSPLNGGLTDAHRFGTFSDAVVARLIWLNHTLAPALGKALTGPMPLIPIAEHGLAGGDDCHGNTACSTTEFFRALAPTTGLCGADLASVTAFVQTAPSFFLNLWMAASKCILMAANGIAGSSVVTCIGANGSDIGLKLASDPDRWITHKAGQPNGPWASDPDAPQAATVVGDSFVVEILGLGAMSWLQGGVVPAEMAPFLGNTCVDAAQHIPARKFNNFRLAGFRFGTLASAVDAAQMPPAISLGVLDATGKSGLIGRGVYHPPNALFHTQ